MCFGSSKKTTDSSSTTAPNNSAIAPAVTNEVNAATSLASQPLQQYQGQLVAPLTQDQNDAIAQIKASSGIAQPYLTQAAQYAQQGATPITATPFSQQAVDQYDSPYQNDVINSTMALENEQDAEQQQSLAGNITAAGAWGGDRSGVVQSELARQQALANNSSIAGIENQGYTQALGQFNTANQQSLATQQANNANASSAAYSLGSIGSAMQNSALNGANALMGAGTEEQQVNQENLDVPYEQYVQQQAYPYQNLDFLSGILGSAAGTSGTTSTGTNVQSTSTPLGPQLLGLGLDAASFLKKGGRARLADGGGFGYIPLPSVPSISSFIPSGTPSAGRGLSSPASMGGGGGGGEGGSTGGSGSNPLGVSAGQLSGAFSGIEDAFGGGGDNPFGNTPLSDMGTGGSGAGNVYLDAAGMVTSPFRKGGRTRLADGGADDGTYMGGDDDQIADAVADVPAGAQAMSLAATPAAWRGQATHYAPAPDDSTVIARQYPSAPVTSDQSASLAASPTWDDGTPVTTDGGSLASAGPQNWGQQMPAHIIQQAYTEKPDWRRSLLTAGSAMMAANGVNGLADVGQGIEAGVKDYYGQEDKDAHPEVDHSGPTTTVRYADGTVVDTGIPTEAAINAKATNDYKTSTATQASADREVRIAEERDAAAARVAEAIQAEKDRVFQAKQAALDREAGINQGRYVYQPSSQPDPTDPTKTVSGYLRLSTKGDEPPQFISGYTPLAKTPATGGMGGISGRESVYFNRVAAAGNEAAQAAQNIMELPRTVSTGIFGGRQQGPGLLGAAKESLTNAATSQDVQDYNTMIAGVSRNLGAIESAGLAPSGALIHSMDSVTLKEGDSDITKMRKMAELRQIVELGLAPNLANPRIPPEQKQLVQGIIGQMQKAIPFTQHDVTALQQSQNPRATILDFAGKSGLSGPKYSEGQVLHQNGNLFKVINGKPVYQGASQ